MGRQTVSTPHRKVCIGDLGSRILLHVRAIDDPIFDDTDFEEDFTSYPATWARIKTTAGKTIFDGVGSDVDISHEIIVRYDANNLVDDDTWILTEDEVRLRVEKVEDYDERHEFVRLLCSQRGSRDKDASKA